MEEVNGYKQYKVTLRKGVVGDQATQYWGKKDWDEHNAYVAELKRTGEYLNPVEVTFNMMPSSLDEDIEPIDFSKSTMLIPNGLGKDLVIPKIDWDNSDFRKGIINYI